VAGVKDKLSGEEWAPVVGRPGNANAVHGEADRVAELQPGQPVVDEGLRQEEAAAPISPGESAERIEDVAHSDLALPTPGLPDEPSFSGEPIISVAEAPDGEPAAADALAWQPEIEPDPDQSSDLIVTDHSVPTQPMQVEAATAPLVRAPEVDAAHDVAAFAHDLDERPAPDAPLAPPDEPLPEPTTAEEVAAEAALEDQLPAELVGSEPTSMEAEPLVLEEEPAAQAEALPDAEFPADAAIVEHTPAELPTVEEPPAQKSTEPAAELPLRDRIPSVRPVELEAIKTPLSVPVFEETARALEARRPNLEDVSHSAEPALAAPLSSHVAIPRSTDDVAPARTPVSDITPLLYRALRLAATAAFALGCLVLVLIVLYRWVNPPASTLMLGQWLTGTRIDQRWVSIDRISPYLQRAVITSEDGRFCRHHGVDWDEIEEALERARDGVARGGSTISMQVVKNLFLWPSKSYVRKALEIPLTYAIELAWSKRRILEIYLNIAEWGPGVFGAEAAARYHFGKPAASLTPSQAALLAVALPNPRERRAGAPGPGTLRLATTLHARMMAGAGNTSCVQARR
jgi:monofunctional biosynthetic peptidoglycan transglycosylase